MVTLLLETADAFLHLIQILFIAIRSLIKGCVVFGRRKVMTTAALAHAEHQTRSEQSLLMEDEAYNTLHCCTVGESSASLDVNPSLAFPHVRDPASFMKIQPYSKRCMRSRKLVFTTPCHLNSGSAFSDTTMTTWHLPPLDRCLSSSVPRHVDD